MSVPHHLSLRVETLKVLHQGSFLLIVLLGTVVLAIDILLYSGPGILQRDQVILYLCKGRDVDSLLEAVLAVDPLLIVQGAFLVQANEEYLVCLVGAFGAAALRSGLGPLVVHGESVVCVHSFR